MKKEHVLFAGKNTQSTSIAKQSVAQENAGEFQGYKLCKIKNIKYLGKQDVYNMRVSGHHNYSVAGGLILHNCDALRYFCKTIVRSWKI